MPESLFTPQTKDELRAERDKVVAQMPCPVEIMRRLRDASAIEYGEDRLLSRYEQLTWAIGDQPEG